MCREVEKLLSKVKSPIKTADKSLGSTQISMECVAAWQMQRYNGKGGGKRRQWGKIKVSFKFFLSFFFLRQRFTCWQDFCMHDSNWGIQPHYKHPRACLLPRPSTPVHVCPLCSPFICLVRILFGLLSLSSATFQLSFALSARWCGSVNATCHCTGVGRRGDGRERGCCSVSSALWCVALAASCLARSSSLALCVLAGWLYINVICATPPSFAVSYWIYVGSLISSAAQWAKYQ